MNSTLQDKAVKSALNKDWECAAKINKKILKSNPTDLNAQLRLAKALIHLKEYKEARKILKNALEEDPLNKIAKKNLDLIEKKVAALTH